MAVAIPVAIHLFNLRRYKTVYFPHTRFLREIQIHSQKQSNLRYKLLLAARALFLIFLVLAFSQPFFSNMENRKASEHLQVIYIDNSGSMTLKKGSLELFELAQAQARTQLLLANPAERFIMMTGEGPMSYQPVSPEQALAQLSDMKISPSRRDVHQVFAQAETLGESLGYQGVDLYYYSDYQRNSFPERSEQLEKSLVNFYGIPVQSGRKSNIYIDTAYLLHPVLQVGQQHQLIVKSRLSGKASKEPAVLQLSVDGQVKTANSLVFEEAGSRADTLSFVVNDAAWQELVLTVSDPEIRFDDTFRIAARSAAHLSVLVINEGQANPYIQAAATAYSGFRLDQRRMGESADWSQYNLILLNGITRPGSALARQVSAALEQGQTVAVFPGRTNELEGLNAFLAELGDIRIAGIDTTAQYVTQLQRENELVRDLFERIPENVQLPLVRWHYILDAGLSANQQSILGFRDGEPFLARYRPSRGSFYLYSAPADLEAGNYPASYFFVPFLYQMTAQSRSGNIYAISAGSSMPVFLSLKQATDRNIVHASGPGLELIPPQRTGGSGIEVFLGQVASHPGFYRLVGEGLDTVLVAVNQDPSESELAVWETGELKERWKGEGISWIIGDRAVVSNAGSGLGGFPLWKVCAILALLLLAFESYLLAGRSRKPNVVPQ